MKIIKDLRDLSEFIICIDKCPTRIRLTVGYVEQIEESFFYASFYDPHKKTMNLEKVSAQDVRSAIEGRVICIQYEPDLLKFLSALYNYDLGSFDLSNLIEFHKKERL